MRCSRMTAAIQEDTVRILFHIRVEQKVEREPAAKVTGTNNDDLPCRHRRSAREKKFTRTIRARAGSGKKYKQWRNAKKINARPCRKADAEMEKKY